MKEAMDNPDLRDGRIGELLRAALEGRSPATADTQITGQISESEFGQVYRLANAENRRIKATPPAFRIIPSVLAACLVLLLAPKGNPAAILPDFRSAVSILSRESVIDDSWNAGSLQGTIASTEDDTISLFVENLWNQDDIGYD